MGPDPATAAPPLPISEHRPSRDESGAWNLCRHADVVRAAVDPTTFSSRVSRHLNLPNGMDGEDHARFRELVDRYLEPGVVAPLEPRFRRLATGLVASLPVGHPVDAVAEIGARFAVRAQSAWLGWPAALEETLIVWMRDNREATRSGQRHRTVAVAARFDRLIRRLIAATGKGDGVTARLLNDRVDGRRLTESEVVSILRNWTAGDLGSIAACAGVLIDRLAVDGELQQRWRRGKLSRPELEAEIDEVLRIDDPFTFNRRLATKDVEIGGCTIRAGEKVKLNWAKANRDPRVIDDPDAFRPHENASHNIVYGVGPHVCPGRGLATLELLVLIEQLLAGSDWIDPVPESDPVRELPPYGGFRVVPIIKRVNPDRV